MNTILNKIIIKKYFIQNFNLYNKVSFSNFLSVGYCFVSVHRPCRLQYSF